ncbi:hypothetical protein KSF73_17305, partial [Burkholderiaceae bacterium DAT-1]|nr:hypothetical protein [Burkholderiaceae bacterium DAT-1]
MQHAHKDTRMASLNSLDPAELMPLPEVPESYGPRNEEDREVYALIQEALESGPGTVYASVAEFATEFRARLRNRRQR